MTPQSSSRNSEAPRILLDHAREIIPGLEARWPRYARYVDGITVLPRTVLLNEGDVPQKIFFVKKGCLRASLMSRGKEITFQFFFEGDAVVSIEGFRNAQPSPISISAVETCELTVLRKEGFELILHENPEMKDLLLELAFRRFADYSRLFLSHLRDTPRQRYLALMRDDPRILERVPQRFIASYLGITPVSLSRIRHRR
jgi:CRP-like cAMP-binding protein